MKVHPRPLWKLIIVSLSGPDPRMTNSWDMFRLAEFLKSIFCFRARICEQFPDDDLPASPICFC